MLSAKKWLFKSLFLACVGLACSASAQESRVAAQAMRCSAFFLVFSESTMAQHFFDAFVKERSDKSAAMSDADLQQRRELILQELKKTYLSDQPAVLEEAVLCGAWSEGFRLQGDQPAFIPILPKIIPQTVREKYTDLASSAFLK